MVGLTLAVGYAVGRYCVFRLPRRGGSVYFLHNLAQCSTPIPIELQQTASVHFHVELYGVFPGSGSHYRLPLVTLFLVALFT